MTNKTAAEPKLETKDAAEPSTAIAPQPVATVENIDTTAILKALLDEVKQIKQDREDDRQRFAEELAQAQLAAAKAIENAANRNDDPFKPNALPENALDPRTDRPATIAEKLQVMEEMAAENGQPFDRERTRRALQGLPVEDANKWVYQGHAFPDEQAMEAYKDKIESEKLATIGKYLR